LAGLDSREDDGPAEIELTYSILDDINQARPAFGRLVVCIIQVEYSSELIAEAAHFFAPLDRPSSSLQKQTAGRGLPDRRLTA